MALSKNKNYLVEVKGKLNPQDNAPTSIMANLPEMYSLDLFSDWQSNMKHAGLETMESFASKILPNLRVLGISPATLAQVGVRYGGSFTNAQILSKDLSRQSWMGSGPIEFTLPLLFDAETSAYNDVMDPASKLMALSMPYEDRRKLTGNIYATGLMPPGESAYNKDGAISLRVGKFFFKSVLILSVSTSIHNRIDATGYPISADVDVRFRTIDSPSREDILNWFSRREDDGGN